MISRAFDAYLSEHRESHLQQLQAFLRYPSISALSEHKPDILACAGFVAEQLTAVGFEHVELLPTAGNPVVYGDWLHAAGAPTVLVYGHYDVQPVDPLPLWTTPPFQPTIRDGRLYARGATDDKGQVFMHWKAFEALLQTTGTLPVNVKFCIEGEEEIGCANLPAFLADHVDRFRADVLMISDSSILGPNQPSICYGLRGLTGLELHLRTANTDLHSGTYGGGVPNALHALAELIAGLHNPDGRVAVKGFYDKVDRLSDDERAAYARLAFDEAALQSSLALPALVGEPEFPYLERVWARPTLEVNGLYGGFQGEGTKTVIPCEAHAKITCRLVPDQDPEEIQQCIQQHVREHAPKGTTVTIRPMDSGRPYLTPFTHPAIQLAAKAYEAAYGVPCAFTRMGGSIPIVEDFDRLLNIPVVMMGFGLATENLHAPNEHFTLENFDLGLRALCIYYLGLAATLASDA